MAEPKTKPTDENVASFLERITDEQKREDCFTLVALMKEATKCDAQMWGTSIVGFATYRYIYASGKERDWPIIAFSPRKESLVVYLMSGFDEAGDLLAGLGKYRHGKGCLYIKRLSDIHIPTLKKVIRESVKEARQRYARP